MASLRLGFHRLGKNAELMFCLPQYVQAAATMGCKRPKYFKGGFVNSHNNPPDPSHQTHFRVITPLFI